MNDEQGKKFSSALGMVSEKLDRGLYHSVQEFKSDVDLTFVHAMTHNNPGSVKHEAAKRLRTLFEDTMKTPCILCGIGKREFRSPLCKWCDKPITGPFYRGGGMNSRSFACPKCYHRFIKGKENDDSNHDWVKLTSNPEEESWVQCGKCHGWLHQICGLYNDRQDKNDCKYCCPKCLVNEKKAMQLQNSVEPTVSTKPPGAKELPVTELSNFLEEQIKARLIERKQELVKEISTSHVSVKL